MKDLSSEEKEIVRKQFCAYCIKVLHGEELNYFKELEKKRKREIDFSELFQKEPNMLYNPIFDSWRTKKSLYPLCLLGCSDFFRCHGV